MSFNFKKYVKHLMLENTFKVDTSKYEDQVEYEYDANTGIYTSKDLSKDPYTYKVVGADVTSVRIKVMSAPPRRQSAVGRIFKIEDDNMSNPNVQLLYAAIAEHEPTKAKLALKASDFYTEGNFETVIGDDDFDFDTFFNKQYNDIISVGKENRNTELINVNQIFKLSLDSESQELNLENQNRVIGFIKSIEDLLETRYGVIVTSIGLQVNHLPDNLREQTESDSSTFKIDNIYVLMKKSALKYYVIKFNPSIKVFISESALRDTQDNPDTIQPIAINVTKLGNIKIEPDPPVEPEVTNYTAPETDTIEPQDDYITSSSDPDAVTFIGGNGSFIDAKIKNGNLELTLDKVSPGVKTTKVYKVIMQADELKSADGSRSIPDIDVYLNFIKIVGVADVVVDFKIENNNFFGKKELINIAASTPGNLPQDTAYAAEQDLYRVSNIDKNKIEAGLESLGFFNNLPGSSTVIDSATSSDLADYASSAVNPKIILQPVN